MRFFVRFSHYRGNEEKMQALIFGQDKYLCLRSGAKICQTGYKQGEYTKTTAQVLVLLLKEFSKKQDF